MCVSPPDSAVFLSGAAASAEPVSASFRKLKVILTNVRGLKQASAELSLRACKFRPHLIGLVETHLCKDALSGLLPQGYSVVGTGSGPGVSWSAKSVLWCALYVGIPSLRVVLWPPPKHRGRES